MFNAAGGNWWQQSNPIPALSEPTTKATTGVAKITVQAPTIKSLVEGTQTIEIIKGH